MPHDQARFRSAAIAAALLVALPAVAATQDAADSRRCDAIAGGTADAVTLEHAKRVIAAEPQGALAAFYQGCQAFVGDQGGDRAAKHFERAVKLDGASSAAHDWLGRAYGDQAQRANVLRQAGLARKTKAAFERAVALDPDNLSARNWLVQYFLLAPGILGGSDEKAFQQVEEIRKRNPYLGGMTAAQAHLNRKQPERAAPEYEALLRQYPDSFGPVGGTYNLHVNRQQYDQAFAVLDAFLGRHPAHPFALYGLGRAASVSGQRLDDGQAALERYTRLQPPEVSDASRANAHYHIGAIHRHRGDVAKARASFEAALRLNPGLKAAKDALAALR